MQIYYVGPPGSSFSHFSDLMQRRRVLYSYATCRYDTVPEGAAGYCLDSGAFTVWKKGKTIEMERLLRWYEQRDTADFKFALDVIGGDEADQRRNLRIMEIEGHDVVPVFHGPGMESWKWFDELCEKYPRVAIGSVLPKNTSKAAAKWCGEVFSRICDKHTGEPRVKIHGLRMTAQMMDFPFASVDGSTWTTGAARGRMPLRHGTRGTSAGAAPKHLTRHDVQRLWVEAWENCPKPTRYFPAQPVLL